MRFILVLTLALLPLVTFAQAPAARPNIVFILADDLGFADLGCYGSEIETPNLDRLAAGGIQLSHYYSTPMCVTTRVALLAGMPYNQSGKGSYSRAMPLPKLLKQAGYTTMMAGKWHAGTPSPRSKEIFDRAFGFEGGSTDNFIGGKDWFLNDRPFNDFGKDFFATDAFTRQSIQFIDEARQTDKPFFLYLAYNAPHTPLQARAATVEKYRERYLAGYPAIRDARHRRQVEMGLVDPAWQPFPRPAEVRPWEELSEHRQRVEADRMAAYAAMIDEMDQNIGLLIKHLEDNNLIDNTLVIFCSDNGGDYNNGSILDDEQRDPTKPRNAVHTSNGWAWVKNTPWRSYKHSGYEGGLALPCIVQWPAGLKWKPGSLVDTRAHVTDFYPTFIELAGVSYPATDGKKQLDPLFGTSLLPLFRNEPTPGHADVWSWYSFSRGYIRGDWKISSIYESPWQLFNLKTDRTETTDLAARNPEKAAELIAAWQDFAKDSARLPLKERQPVGTEEIYWGQHRLDGNIVSMLPKNSSAGVPVDTDLTLTFNGPIDFKATQGKPIRLYKVSDEEHPVWQADPDETHPAQGKNTVTFTDLPRLEPGANYYFLWDAGWLKIGNKPIQLINDGAFWYRFRTVER